MSEQNTDLLKEAGVIVEEKPENVLPDEMTDPAFLDSPIGRIMQTLAALELAAQSFSERIATCERWLMWLAAKDPIMGPRIAELNGAAKQAGIASEVELTSGAIQVNFGGNNEGRSE